MFNKSFIFILVVLFVLSPVSACGSVANINSFGFERDSSVAANISIQNISGNIIESKPNFVHSIVWNDSDAVGFGGLDGWCNWVEVQIVSVAHYYDRPELVFLCVPFVWYNGGHVLYKYDNHAIGISFVGGIYIQNVDLSNDSYYVVRNDAKSCGSYRVDDINSAIESNNNVPVDHRRYFIVYEGGNWSVNNYKNERFI